MSKLEVAKVEGSEKQVTIDFESGTIVDGFLENHVVFILPPSANARHYSRIAKEELAQAQ
jgi:hypothetical protein